MTGPTSPRALLDSWVLAVALATAVHVAVAWTVWPSAAPRVEVPYPSFTLLVGGPGGGGSGRPGDGGGPGIADDGPRVAAVPSPDAVPVPVLEAQDLPRGGTMPVRLADRSRERASVVEQVAREQRVRAVLEEIGATPSVAAPTGGGGGSGGWGSAGGGSGGVGWGSGGGGGGGDPELYRWKTEVEARFRESFHPLVPSGRMLACAYLVDYDPTTGAVTGFALHRTSGEPAFDAAAERAIRRVEYVPLPPERYAARVGTRLVVDFEPP